MTQHGRKPHRHHTQRGHNPDSRRDSFAVLLTARPPLQPLPLLAVGLDEDPRQAYHKFRFIPLMHFAERNAVLGLIDVEAEGEPPVEIMVQRGRRGQRAAERLLLLGQAQAGITAWPKPRLSGVLKAVGRALSDVCGGAVASQPCWWLACQLAMRGSVRRAEWKACWRRVQEDRPQLGPRIERLGPYLVWSEYLAMLCDGLEHQLLRGKRNPLLGELTPAAASALAGVDDEHLAPRLLELLAEKHGLKLVQSAGETALPLSGALAPPPAHESDLRVAEEIVELFARGEGCSPAALAQRYPAHKHVLHWLFAAGRLVETGEGFVFTRQQLRDILAGLKERGIAPEEASTGVLRKDLGVKRPAAEALRRYFQRRFGAAAGQREGQDG